MRLEFRNVSVIKNGVHILKDVSFSIPESKNLTLLGPSGGGKSTILRVVAGLVVPNEGEAYLNGVLVPKSEEALQMYRRSIGTVFQSWNLFPHLTVIENIALPLYRVHGYTRKQAYDLSLDLLSRFGLISHAEHTPLELSGGQSQRVAIIRAVAVKPKLLLFDEPTSALDPIMTSEVLDLIAELKQQGSDFILVSHHLSFAKKIADFIAFVADGKVIETSPSQDFFSHPNQLQSTSFLNQVLKY